jgi:TctA family transporter
MWPSVAELKQSFLPMVRGTLIGGITGFLPAVGPTISSLMSYAVEKKLAGNSKRFGHGALEGVVSPEASTHANVQIDFIPTLTLGIPGEAVMALLLSALMIKGITPGPQLMGEHPDIFWGLVASFWVGNVLLVIMNMPLIGIWVKLLSVPYRFLFPTALFFMCIGVWSTNNSLFDVGETVFFGIAGYLLTILDFEFAPVLLGLVLGPLVEENFRRALVISRGDLGTFIEHPISAIFIAISAALVLFQLYGAVRPQRRPALLDLPVDLNP